jgi:hypothetical protein
MNSQTNTKTIISLFNDESDFHPYNPNNIINHGQVPNIDHSDIIKTNYFSELNTLITSDFNPSHTSLYSNNNLDKNHRQVAMPIDTDHSDIITTNYLPELNTIIDYDYDYDYDDDDDDDYYNSMRSSTNYCYCCYH